MTMLQIKGLNTYYGESHILRDVDMNINQGEMICLIGRNGVGKTTLLKSLIGLLTPRRGEIFLMEIWLIESHLIKGLVPELRMFPKDEK